MFKLLRNYFVYIFEHCLFEFRVKRCVLNTRFKVVVLVYCFALGCDVLLYFVCHVSHLLGKVRVFPFKIQNFHFTLAFIFLVICLPIHECLREYV